MMVHVLQDSALSEMTGLGHGFFTRLGGVSLGCFDSLNCSLSSQDNAENIYENRRRALAQLGQSATALMTVKNAHGKNVVTLDQPLTEIDKIPADGLVTRLPGLVLGSSSADCPTLLFVDATARVIGIAHAGWKGAKLGVLEATVQAMEGLGANRGHVSAAISPCIHQPSYEVGEEFYQAFVDDDKSNHALFQKNPKTKNLHFDMLGFVKHKLQQLNLLSISTQNAFDTYADERFFSCRRALHQGQKDFGGQLSCIYLL